MWLFEGSGTFGQMCFLILQRGETVSAEPAHALTPQHEAPRPPRERGPPAPKADTQDSLVNCRLECPRVLLPVTTGNCW